MAHITIMRTYADRVDPLSLPATVRLCSSDFSITVHDRDPKSEFHFLLIPFIRPPLRAADVHDLQALFQLRRERVKSFLQLVRRDALEAKMLVEQQMIEKYGFKWGIQIGFLAIDNVEYVPPVLKHLRTLMAHIVSTDFRNTQYMDTKGKVNAFHPKRGYFLHLDEMLAWFDPGVEPTWFAMKTTFDVAARREYRKILKKPMICPVCDKPMTTTDKMKKHLGEDWEEMLAVQKAGALLGQLAQEEAAAAASADNGAASSSKRTHDQTCEDAAAEADESADDDGDADLEAHPAKRREVACHDP